MGEQALKGVDAAGLPLDAKPGKHVTLFDVLKPTDIVAMGTEAGVSSGGRQRPEAGTPHG